MTQLRRYSPVVLDAVSHETEMRNGWKVVLAYENEGSGPFLTDLSHLEKWEIQDFHLSAVPVSGETIPERAGECSIENHLVINRISRRTSLVYRLPGAFHDFPINAAVTDASDAWCLIGMAGKGADQILMYITDTPLLNPAGVSMRYAQGKIWDIPCHMTFLGFSKIVLIAAPRGFGQSLVHAVVTAGEQAGLQPAGEKRFMKAVQGYIS